MTTFPSISCYGSQLCISILELRERMTQSTAG
jgi:hypothetical protein